MAILYTQSNVIIATLALVLLISFPSKVISQLPTIADCTSQLLPLTPCAPFVQGIAQSPPPSCCNNINQLYLQRPGCLCLFLNSTNLSSFPINSTLALQLPALCHIQLNIPACSGVPQVPTTSPASQVSSGARTNSSSGINSKSSNSVPNNASIAVSPMFQMAPRPVAMGFGFGHSASIKLCGEGLLVLLVSLTAILLTQAIHCV